jgi:Lon protease-like protein
MTDTEFELPLFPLERVVLFPSMPLPLRIFEERYKVMIGACQVTDQVFGVMLIRSGAEVGEPAVPERVGCTARMLRIDRLPDGQMNIFSVGEQRFRLLGPPRVMPEGYLVADARLLAEPPSADVPASLVAAVLAELETYQAALLARAGQSDKKPPEPPSDALRLSFWVGGTLHVHPRERQQLLEIDDLEERLRAELTLLRRENQPAAKTIGPFSVN